MNTIEGETQITDAGYTIVLLESSGEDGTATYSGTLETIPPLVQSPIYPCWTVLAAVMAIVIGSSITYILSYKRRHCQSY